MELNLFLSDNATTLSKLLSIFATVVTLLVSVAISTTLSKFFSIPDTTLLTSVLLINTSLLLTSTVVLSDNKTTLSNSFSSVSTEFD